ncbi:DEAD/DEAH box helicase [Anaerobacillus sp. MEB173]|uniref:DEAD/DEAH box helicase n=1 Tax=Anaerobacillus sp. MEB173 TaxID=3383345 RepID=UPI003F902C4C
MYNPNPIIVHGGWLDLDSLTLFIWGERKEQKRYRDIINFSYPFLFSPFELKLALFRFDRPSYYGTFINTIEASLEVPLQDRMFYSEVGSVPVYHASPKKEYYLFPLQGIGITLEELPQHLNTMAAWENETSEWIISSDLSFWISFIKQIQEEIRAGRIVPNQLGKWELTKMDWELWAASLPNASLALENPNLPLKPLQQQKEQVNKIQYITQIGNEIADALIRDLLNRESKVKESFKNVRKTVTGTTRSLLNHLEKKRPIAVQKGITTNLLEEIGAVATSPFQTGITVQEPKHAEGTWSLQLFIKDRYDPSIMFSVAELQHGNHPWRENPIVKLKQDLQKAKAAVPLLQKLTLTNPAIHVTLEEVYSFLSHDSSRLEEAGLTVLVPSWWNLKQQEVTVEYQISEDSAMSANTVDPILNWEKIIDFDYSISIGDNHLSEKEFSELVNRKQGIIQIHGKWLVWDPKQAKKLKEQLDSQKESVSYFDALQMDIKQAHNSLDSDDQFVQLKISWNEKIETLLTELQNKETKTISIPPSLNGQLRPYQEEGVSWLIQMRRAGFGACLADDMGLGKSIQTIAYLLIVKEAKNQNNNGSSPFLLICPTSLLGNWHQEFSRFAPSLRVFIHHGKQRLDEEQFLQEINEYDIVITTYQLIVRDEKLFTEVKWNALIFDEAQQTKNVETKQRKAIRKIHALHKIALTGTPIENRLKELWSIIDLLNHHYLGSYQEFQRNFIKPIEGNEKSDEKMELLQKVISPFLLRRSKSDQSLNLQLPSKQEITYRVGLTVEQASLYQAVVNDLLTKVDAVSEMERRALILSSLTKLKQICNHPAQFLKENAPLRHRSEKWEQLLILLDQIQAKNEKALLFTQYKQMGMLLQQGLNDFSHKKVPFLHGSLPPLKREELIHQFADKDGPNLFILSLKAGGVGLNLTAANHVIHYDRWWNPAVENQATDRAYRIGQSQDVTVHKMVTVGTLEEKIDEMLERKQHLSEQILNANDTRISELTTKQLEQLLMLRTVDA